jgi:hypothetical protein
MEDNNLNNEDIESTTNSNAQWTTYYEDIFIDWCDKAMSYRYLHSTCYRYYYRQHVWFTIPVIFISTLTGVANFAQDRINEENQFYYTMAVGSFNIIAGFITTVSQFLKVNELSEGHRISAISWDKLYRNIRVELAKNPRERENITLYLKKIKEQYDLLLETSPEIRLDVINKFNKTFKKSEFLRPEICNTLTSVRNTMYKHDYNNDDDLKAVKSIKERRHSIMNTLEIDKFVKNYTEQHKREPSVEEIYDNLEDQVNKKYIDTFVEKLNKKIENKKIENKKIESKDIKQNR